MEWLKVLQSTLTYKIWMQSDKKWWFCNTFLYFVFKDLQQNDMSKTDKLNCFTVEFNLFKVKYFPSSNKPRVQDQIWRIFITFLNVRHVVFTKYKRC